jgi:hypothetical protein
MKDESPAQLGDRVKCRVTGYTGIVTAVTHWLNGCRRLGIQDEKLKDGKPAEAQYFDDEQLEVVKRGVHKPVTLAKTPAPPAQPSRTGGPSRESAGFRR